MASFATFWRGFLVLIIFCLVGFVLSYFGGKFMDTFLSRYEEAGYLTQNVEHPSTMSDFYNHTTKMGDYKVYLNLYYLFCYFFPIMGCVLFYQSIVKNTRQEQIVYR